MADGDESALEEMAERLRVLSHELKAAGRIKDSKAALTAALMMVLEHEKRTLHSQHDQNLPNVIDLG